MEKYNLLLRNSTPSLAGVCTSPLHTVFSIHRLQSKLLEFELPTTNNVGRRAEAAASSQGHFKLTPLQISIIMSNIYYQLFYLWTMCVWVKFVPGPNPKLLCFLVCIVDINYLLSITFNCGDDVGWKKRGKLSKKWLDSGDVRDIRGETWNQCQR